MTTPLTSPLVRQPHEEKIVFALSVLQVAVKNCGLIGLVGINTVSEPFFRDFLNVLYGLNLTNLNNGISNYPAIDLGDTSSRICFQVSSDGKKNKLQKTLKTFGDPQHNLTQAYDTIRVFVIGHRQGKYDGLAIPAGVVFNPDTDVIDVPTIIAALPNTSVPQLTALSQIIDHEMPMFATATAMERHTDAEVLGEYRSYFCRRAMLDPWQQEGNVAQFRVAVDALLGLLTTGHVQGVPVTKPFRRIADPHLKSLMDKVHLKLMMLRQLFTHHERIGDIDPIANFGNFNNPKICVAFDTYRQDVIDELNHVLVSASLQPMPGVMTFP